MQQQIASSFNETYTEEERAAVSMREVPHHVAVIMDGNRRWALERGLPSSTGHFRGASQLDPIVRAAVALGVRVLTVYAFSTENWGRSQIEVTFLMRLLKTYLKQKKHLLAREGVQLCAIGDLTKMPSFVQRELEMAMAATKGGENLDLVLAVNYGGRNEICRALQKMSAAEKRGELDLSAATERDVARFLDTARWPDPELIIRTSGEQRTSNFLNWQAAYSEMVVTKVMWPDFSTKDFLDAILEYQRRQCRFGE